MLYDIDWHNLPVDIQISIKLLIKRKQNQHGLAIGPFDGSLNHEMFKLVSQYIILYLRDPT